MGGWAGRQARRGAEGYATGMDPLRAPTSLAEAQMMTANRLAGTVVTSKPAGAFALYGLCCLLLYCTASGLYCRCCRVL